MNLRLFLFDGYDWDRTRKAIQTEIKRVKKRLAKIRQLLASGQTFDPTVDEVNTLLFNSVYVGLDQEAEELEAGALIEKIDKELDEDDDSASVSSWQSFKPSSPRGKPGKFPVLHPTTSTNARAKKLVRARSPSIEFSLQDLNAEFDLYRPGGALASRLLFTVRELEILDHIRTSTWSTFLTQLRADSVGNVRETDSNMVRVELQSLLPYAGHQEQEARLKVCNHWLTINVELTDFGSEG